LRDDDDAGSGGKGSLPPPALGDMEKSESAMSLLGYDGGGDGYGGSGRHGRGPLSALTERWRLKRRRKTSTREAVRQPWSEWPSR